MDFGALPPELNSGRMYVGPGPATLLAAAAERDALAAELRSAADAYQAVVTGLTDESWTGQSSMSMVAAVAPYLRWMRTAAVQCEEAATRATAAATAYETAFAMTVPPPAILANRVRLATLIATNSLGQNTPAIAATEARYSEMSARCRQRRCTTMPPVRPRPRPSRYSPRRALSVSPSTPKRRRRRRG